MEKPIILGEIKLKNDGYYGSILSVAQDLFADTL
jgi:hypothetical protein